MNAKLVRLLPFLSLLAPNLLADPLSSWHPYPVWTGDALRAVAYGGGTFVAVGNEIVTSTNGLAWAANPTQRTESLIDVAYGEGVFVAVGWFREAAEVRTILTSTNGVDWTPSLVTTNASMLCVAHGSGMFIAAGLGKSFMVSHDGLNWTQHDFATDQEQVVQRVLFADGKFVAVGSFGDRATVWISPDGTNWTQTYSVDNDTCYGVAYGGGVFVATSVKGKAITSPDGVSWRPTVAGYALGQIAYGNGTFVAMTTPTAFLTSSDGVGWTPRTSNFRGPAYLSFAEGIFLAVDATSGLQSSVDGINWINRKHGTGGELQRVIYANGSFVAVGQDELILT